MERSQTALEELFGTALGPHTEKQHPLTRVPARYARNDSGVKQIPRFARNDIARRARTAVLERIIIPVDSVFGRVKHVNLDVLAGGATADFERWLADSSGC